ncbi:MAG: efflux RND transporter periplasmic adaptor subunit [Methyloceanibacter sp.]|nr:efflux RND transporter periplasmic adaptor subunit [Methyloceanibacter sp.]
MRLTTRTKLLGLTTAIVVSASAILYATTKNEVAARTTPVEPPLASVSVVAPEIRKVTEWDAYAGRFEPTQLAEIRARVSGHLIEINFRDGDMVQEGQTLFTIDPRPYEAELAIAKARIDEAQARLHLANIQLERSNRLVKTKAVSQARVDQHAAEQQTASAVLSAARAQLRRAELDLEYTRIKSPVSGRVDRRLMDVGNLIIANETLLTNVVALDPIYVTFDVNQNDYIKYTEYDRAGTRVSSRKKANPVQVALGNSRSFSIGGYMDYVANQIDQDTGTIRARAIVENDDYSLTPGLFARVKLLSRESVRTVLIPDEAISLNQSDWVVHVVDSEDTVQTRIVSTGPLVDGKRVIRDGIDEGDRVVVSGLQKIRPGQEVIAEAIQPNTKKLALR